MTGLDARAAARHRHDIRVRRAGSAGIELFALEYPHDYPEVEATLVALRSGLRLAQVQVEMRERTTGTSSITFIAALYYIVKVTLAVLVASMRRYPRLEGVER